MEPIKPLGKINLVPCFSKAVLKGAYIVNINYQAKFNANKLVLPRLSLIKMGGMVERKVLFLPFSILDSNPVNYLCGFVHICKLDWILNSNFLKYLDSPN